MRVEPSACIVLAPSLVALPFQLGAMSRDRGCICCGLWLVAEDPPWPRLQCLLLSQQVRDASNFAADQFEFLKIPKTKTNEEDVPAWWKE